MAEQRICPQCGTPVPASSPEAICPRCLLLAGLASEPSASQPAATLPSPVRHDGFVPPAVAEIARAFPQLEILELIGRGGMGAVYKARQRELDRLVALKILPPDIGSDAAFAQRFAREARALAKLNHPHIVTIFDSGQSGGFYFLLMEYVDGVNLRQTMRTARLSPPEALAIVPQICDALQYAHDEGIVHRDIKPENILIDKRGRVKIADFGLAKLLASGAESPESMSHLTATAQVMGTLRYMAPEQMESAAHVDHRADIYSLGVVFYELLTGEVPMGRFDPPSKRVEVDVRLDDIVLRTLEREPQRRYQHASDVKSDVQTVTSLPAVAARAATKLASNHGARHADVDLDTARQEVKVPGLALIFVGVLYLLISVVPLCVLPALWFLTPVDRAPPKDSRAQPISACKSIPTSGMLAAIIATDGVLAIDGPHHELLSAALLAQDAAPAAGRGMPNGFMILLLLVGLALLLQLPLSVLMIVGGWRMQRLESHGLAVLASLVALLPCQPLFPLGLIVGIWSLMVLNRAHVKAAFASASAGANPGGATTASSKWRGSPVTQLRFAVSNDRNIVSQAIFHFSSLGYELLDQRPDVCVFERGRKSGGLWETDIRLLHTRLTLRTAPAAQGTTWVSCDWSVRTMGSWVTRRDIAKLEAEGRDLETLLQGGEKPHSAVGFDPTRKEIPQRGRQSLIDRELEGQVFKSQIYPRDTGDILLVFVTAPLILGVFAMLPGGAAMLLAMAFGAALWQSIALAALVGSVVFIVGCIILGTGSVRSIALDHDGFTINRFVGPSKFLPWSNVRRIAPISRLQALMQVWLWPGLPPRGSIVCMSVSGYQRIDCEGDCWYFCPRNVERFYGAVEHFRASASETADVELPPPTTERDDVLHYIGGPTLGMFALGFGYVLLGIVLLIVVSFIPGSFSSAATTAPFYGSISIWGAMAIFCGASVVLGMIAFIAGQRMLALRGWSVAMAATVVAAIPLGLIFGLPLGVMRFYPLISVWAFVALLQPKVRAQFFAEPGQPSEGKEPHDVASRGRVRTKPLWLVGVGVLLFALVAPLVVRFTRHEPVGDYIIYDVVVDPSRNASPVDTNALVQAVDRRVNTGFTKVAMVSAGYANATPVITIAIYGENPETRKQIIRRLDAAGTLDLRLLAHRTVDERIVKWAQETTGDDVADASTGDETPKTVARWVPVTAQWLEQKLDDKNMVTRESSDGQQQVLVLLGSTDVSHNDLESVAVTTDDIASPALAISFNAQGAQRMAALTGEHVSTDEQARYLAILIDDRLQSSPRIMAQVTNKALITGRFTHEEAADLAAVLQAGALPAKLVRSTRTLPHSFDGDWVCVYLERDGVAAKLDRPMISNFNGEQFVVEQDGKIIVAGTSKVDPNKHPQEIDTTYTAGEYQGQTIKGIRKIEGERITFCRAGSSDDPRPTEFTTTPGSGRLLTIYERRR